jgi:hypothetical protein
MKHFTITSDTEAAALRPYRMSKAEEPKVGDIVSPIAGCAVVTQWPDYPEADAMTFEECMAIVRDEVTEEVLREVGGKLYFEHPKLIEGELYFEHPKLIEGEKWIGFNLFAEWDKDACVEMALNSRRVTFNGINIPNPTATKIKLLAAILRGENI